MANTRETMGEQACLDALVANTLTSFEDDGVTKVGSGAFYNNSSITSVTLSKCDSIGATGFSGCSSLKVVDIQGNGDIGVYALNGSGLTHLVLRGQNKTQLYNADVLNDTYIAYGDGAVYVPSSLLATYEADSKWKNFRIVTLEKYPLSDFSTIEDDWDTIISKSEAGTASDSYSIGDTKLIDLGSEGKVYAQIVAFGADSLASDPTKTAGITFVTKGLLATIHRMNPSNSSGAQGTGGNGGWEYSEMRTYLSDTILPLFPSALQSGIKTVTKYSDYIVPGESAITHDQETQDKLWIPSAREVFGGSSYEQTGPIYNGLFNSTSNRIKRATGRAARNWWVRSAYSTTQFRCVAYSGYVDYEGSDPLYGTKYIALGFCI